MIPLRRTVALLTLAIGGICAPALVLASPASAMPHTTGTAVIAEAATMPGFTATGGSATATAAYGAFVALRSGDAAVYSAKVAELAGLVGQATGIDPAAFVAAWTSSDVTRMSAMLAALSQVGAGYRYNSQTPGVAFDCSGLASWAWAQAGVGIPHQSRAIMEAIPKDSIDGITPGDVLYYPGHVMVSLGVPGAFVHAADRRRGIEVSVLKGRHAKSIRVGDPLG
jgi:cell wall-associated NlpC family hydrolase